nr:diacylglycerol kinase family protein [Streptomyces sp. NBC_00995]WSW71188.1 diacylglycerol kinase family protein [Streptomyces sp. NBC_00995]
MVQGRQARSGLLVANPLAGRRSAGLIDAVLRHSSRRLEDVRVVRTAYPGHAEQLAAATADGATDVLITVGGDGTTREVAAGLARAHREQPHSPGAALVNVPAGTGNSFYREIWSDRPWPDALDAALSAGNSRVRHVDLLQIRETGTPVVLGTGSGFVAEVTHAAARHAGVTGRERYRRALDEVLRSTKPYPGRIRVDGALLHEGDIHLTNVGGGRYRAGHYQLLPRSVPDDGLLDICVMTDGKHLADLLELSRSGRHLERPGVLYAQGTEIVVERTDGGPLVLEYDGEPETGGLSRCTIGISAGALPVLAPLS